MFKNVLILLGRFSSLLLPLLIGIVGTKLILDSLFAQPVVSGATETKSFIVDQGATMRSIADSLEAQGLVKHAWSFYLLTKLKSISSQIVAGEYELSPGMTPEEILNRILSGEIVYHQVTIPAGARTADIPFLLAETGLASLPELQEAITSQNLMDELSIPAASFEGYLFPGDYKFNRPIDARTMIVRLVAEGRKQISDKMIERMIDLGYTFHQILTLASLIQAETSDPEAQKNVSSVYHNRLQIGMPLQSDPSVRYGLQKFEGELTQDDIRSP
ncbi:MAG: endolytic transglycosylase MltG, partial [Bdellovibrionales bacterium]|nr:endolytic transglycosylase MltG [Bdellovibrionales bacterium]